MLWLKHEKCSRAEGGVKGISFSVLVNNETNRTNRGGVAQWVARLTLDRWILVSREFEPIKGPRCFLEQETLLLLLSTGWFQERIRA